MKGTSYTLVYTYPGAGNWEVEAELESVAMGSGDLWMFVLPDGTRTFINPYHYGLVEIRERTEPAPCP